MLNCQLSSPLSATQGNKYWRFKNMRMDKGYPKLISTGFAGIPDNVDASFVWGGNGKTYFFKGDLI